MEKVHVKCISCNWSGVRSERAQRNHNRCPKCGEPCRLDNDWEKPKKQIASELIKIAKNLLKE